MKKTKLDREVSEIWWRVLVSGTSAFVRELDIEALSGGKTYLERMPEDCDRMLVFTSLDGTPRVKTERSCPVFMPYTLVQGLASMKDVKTAIRQDIYRRYNPITDTPLVSRVVIFTLGDPECWKEKGTYTIKYRFTPVGYCTTSPQH